MSDQWWKESIVYQIYPRSFKDTNEDGIGDLNGITEKLDYIKDLGIDTLWLCPVFRSPNDDNGYDISDYCNIMEDFGNMDDFDDLLHQAHKKGLKIIMDLVVNHSSDEHYWFRESKKSKHNPYRDYYFWKSPVNGGPPNNWPSFFGGSAWKYDSNTGEYYLHLFSEKQPDLNWETPKLREEVYNLMRFWLDKGVDGFRMDVIPLISKRLDFKPVTTNNFLDIIHKVYANGPRTHEFLKEMNQQVLSHYDIMTVGEGVGITPEESRLYVDRNRKELNMIFHFDHMNIDNEKEGKYNPRKWKLSEFKNIFLKWDKAVSKNGWNSIFLGNHDYPRIVSRFGNDTEYRELSAKLLAVLLLTHRGTVFLYQGDEIGMTNTAFDQIEDYRDIETLNSYNEAKKNGKNMAEFMKLIHRQSRDNARTPMQWNNSLNAGFTSGTPWLGVNSNYPEINVEKCKNDKNSIFHFYKKMIKFRKGNKVMVHGKYLPLEISNENIFAYLREDDRNKFLILLNFSSYDQVFKSDKFTKETRELIISNYPFSSTLENTPDFNLKPWESNIYRFTS